MSLPSGFTVRGIELTDGDGPDVDLALAVVRADDATVLDEVDETRESVRMMLTSPDAIRSEHRLVLAPDGEAAGLLAMEREGDSDRVFFDAYALPKYKAKMLPGLIDLALEAAPRIAPGEIRSAGHAGDELLMQALTSAGFTFRRRFWRMRILLDGYPIDEPEAPLGVTKSVASSENDRRLLHSVHTSAFADHFEPVTYTYENWFAWSDGRRDARPDLRWIAWRDGEVVAECTADDSRAEFGQSYVRTLSVLPVARGLGIARWLLRSQFAQAAREGRRAVMLTVDSESPTGATRLYESVGMQPVQVIDLLVRA